MHKKFETITTYHRANVITVHGTRIIEYNLPNVSSCSFCPQAHLSDLYRDLKFKPVSPTQPFSKPGSTLPRVTYWGTPLPIAGVNACHHSYIGA